MENFNCNCIMLLLLLSNMSDYRYVKILYKNYPIKIILHIMIVTSYYSMLLSKFSPHLELYAFCNLIIASIIYNVTCNIFTYYPMSLIVMSLLYVGILSSSSSSKLLHSKYYSLYPL